MSNRRFTIWLSLLVAGLVASSLPAAQVVSLNGTWRHWTGPDTHVPIDVPFSVEPVGAPVAYQRLFTLPAGVPTDAILLRFEGLAGKSKIYLNGTLLGQRESFTPFWFDVSDLIDPAGENDLIVEIDDRRDVTTIPYEDIPWVHFSGIIRDVQLRCSDGAVLLSAQPQYDLAADFGSCSGTVAVEAFAEPGTPVRLEGAILERVGDNWVAAAVLSGVTVPADADARAAASLPFALNAPRLWSPQTPELYYLYTVASIGGAVVDERMVPTGFRDIRVEGNKILLNGEPILLKGVSYHGIYPGTGYVGTEAQMLDDLQAIKAAGANYVRTIHYPQHPRLLEIADEIGLLVSEEVPAWANFWDADVRQRLYAMLEAMIRRDMHHPSIFLWVSGNARAWPMPYAAEAQQLCKSLDSNRLGSYVIDNDQYDPDTIAQDVAFFHEAGLDLYMKITWWFYYVEYLQDAWANFPKDIPLVITEFGREGNDREPIVVDGDDLFWFGEEQQADAVGEMLEAWRPHLPMYNTDEHVSGLVYFNFQDLDWPDIDRYLPNHIPSMHHGLFYEDRAAKLVYDVLADFYLHLPTEYVGLPVPEDAIVERRFDQPANLGAGLNGINRDSGPSLSADGRTLYWASDGPDYVGLSKLFCSRWSDVDGAWSPPQLVNIPQESEPFAFRRAPSVSADGQTLYFTRALVSGIYLASTRIWCSQREGQAWGQPQDLGDVINYPDAARATSDPCISADGTTLYFSSDRPGGYGRSDLWVSHRVNGEWTVPENLGPEVNSEAGESEPSISADGRTLYFSSDRPGGMGGNDIWVTHREGLGWSPPRNLGPEVNSTGADREPEVAANGRELFFTGIRSGGVGLSDLWMVRSLFASVDFDRDGDIDQTDFGYLQRCQGFDNSMVALQPECIAGDLDEDGLIDENDLAALIQCHSGPNLPADRDCVP